MTAKRTWAAVTGCVCVFLLAAAVSSPAGAVEIRYEIQPDIKIQKRRLVPDPDRVSTAPTALEIEYTAVTESPQAAVRVAGDALSASWKAYGKADARSAGALINFAYAEQRAGSTDAATRDFDKAIALVGSAPAPRAFQLFEAWYGMGTTKLVRGDAAAANAAFDHALRAYGPSEGRASDRIDVLDALALTQRQMGASVVPARLQRERVTLARQNFAVNTDEYAHTFTSAGRYFRSIGDPDDAVALHRVAINSREQAYGRQSPELISPLLDLALSIGRLDFFRGISTVRSSEQGTLIERALELTEQRRDVSVDERAKGLAFIGDVNWLVGRHQSALDAYGRATSTLQKAPESKTSLFDLPAFLAFDPPRLAPQIARQPGGSVTAHFAVDARGRVQDAQIVGATHPYYEAVLGPKLKTALQAAILRPRLENGVPVATLDVTYKLPVDR